MGLIQPLLHKLLAARRRAGRKGNHAAQCQVPRGVHLQRRPASRKQLSLAQAQGVGTAIEELAQREVPVAIRLLGCGGHHRTFYGCACRSESCRNCFGLTKQRRSWTRL